MSRAGRASTGLVAFGTFGMAGAQWLIVWLFARTAGPQAAGAYALSFSIATPVFLLASLGLRGVYLTYPHPVRFSSYLKVRVAASAGGVAALAGVSALAGVDPALTCAMAAMKASDAVLDLLLGRVQHDGRMLRLGALMAARPVVTVAAALVSVAVTGQVLAGVWACAAVNVAVLAAAFVAAGDWREPGLTSAMAGPLRVAAPVTVSQVCSALLSYVPVWLAGWLGGPDGAGVFAAASYVVVAANLAGSSAQTAVLSGYRAAASDGRLGDVVLSARRLAWRLFAAGAAAGLVVLGAGDAVLALVYGPGFVVGPGALAGLGVAVALTAPSFILGAALMVAGRYTAQTTVGVAAVLVAAAAGVVAGVSGVGGVEAGCVAAAAGAAARFAVFFRLTRPAAL